jgi:hypothetical protein
MVKVGMCDEYMFYFPLFLFVEHRADGAGVQEQRVVDEKGRCMEIGKFRAGAPQYS